MAQISATHVERPTKPTVNKSHIIRVRQKKTKMTTPKMLVSIKYKYMCSLRREKKIKFPPGRGSKVTYLKMFDKLMMPLVTLERIKCLDDSSSISAVEIEDLGQKENYPNVTGQYNSSPQHASPLNNAPLKTSYAGWSKGSSPNWVSANPSPQYMYNFKTPKAFQEDNKSQIKYQQSIEIPRKPIAFKSHGNKRFNTNQRKPFTARMIPSTVTEDAKSYNTHKPNKSAAPCRFNKHHKYNAHADAFQGENNNSMQTNCPNQIRPILSFSTLNNKDLDATNLTWSTNNQVINASGTCSYKDFRADRCQENKYIHSRDNLMNVGNIVQSVLEDIVDQVVESCSHKSPRHIEVPGVKFKPNHSSVLDYDITKKYRGCILPEDREFKDLTDATVIVSPPRKRLSKFANNDDMTGKKQKTTPSSSEYSTMSWGKGQEKESSATRPTIFGHSKMSNVFGANDKADNSTDRRLSLEFSRHNWIVEKYKNYLIMDNEQKCTVVENKEIEVKSYINRAQFEPFSDVDRHIEEQNMKRYFVDQVHKSSLKSASCPSGQRNENHLKMLPDTLGSSMGYENSSNTNSDYVSHMHVAQSITSNIPTDRHLDIVSRSNKHGHIENDNHSLKKSPQITSHAETLCTKPNCESDVEHVFNHPLKFRKPPFSLWRPSDMVTEAQNEDKRVHLNSGQSVLDNVPLDLSTTSTKERHIQAKESSLSPQSINFDDHVREHEHHMKSSFYSHQVKDHRHSPIRQENRFAETNQIGPDDTRSGKKPTSFEYDASSDNHSNALSRQSNSFIEQRRIQKDISLYRNVTRTMLQAEPITNVDPDPEECPKDQHEWKRSINSEASKSEEYQPQQDKDKELKTTSVRVPTQQMVDDGKVMHDKDDLYPSKVGHDSELPLPDPFGYQFSSLPFIYQAMAATGMVIPPGHDFLHSKMTNRNPPSMSPFVPHLPKSLCERAIPTYERHGLNANLHKDVVNASDRHSQLFNHHCLDQEKRYQSLPYCDKTYVCIDKMTERNNEMVRYKTEVQLMQHLHDPLLLNPAHMEHYKMRNTDTPVYPPPFHYQRLAPLPESPLFPRHHLGNMPPHEQPTGHLIKQPRQAVSPGHVGNSLKSVLNAKPDTLAPSLLLYSCVVCNRRATFLCSGCKRVAYCTSGCQIFSWIKHKEHCVSYSSNEDHVGS